MTNRIIVNESDSPITKLRRKICEKLPNGSEWLTTPHRLLAGKHPNSGWQTAMTSPFGNLFESILYIGLLTRLPQSGT